MEKKANPFKEFINMFANVFDLYEIKEDGTVETYKSDELLALFDKFYKWNKELGTPIVIAEDEYDVMAAKNQALNRLAEMFDLEVEP